MLNISDDLNNNPGTAVLSALVSSIRPVAELALATLGYQSKYHNLLGAMSWSASSYLGLSVQADTMNML